MSVLPSERDLVIGWPRERVDYLLTIVEVAGRRLSSANEGSEKLLLLSAGHQGVISAKSVWERLIWVKKVCDKICQKLQYKVLFMAKIALNKSYGGNDG